MKHTADFIEDQKTAKSSSEPDSAAKVSPNQKAAPLYFLVAVS